MSPWDSSYSFTTPGYANFGGGGGGAPQFGLANQTNRFMSGQAALPYQQNLPGYGSMVSGESNNILDMIGGELPDDVVNQILQRGAERGIMTGSPGGPNSSAAYLKAIGLTSLDMQKQGAERLSQAVARTPVPEIWNPMSMYVPQTLAAQGANYARMGASGGGGGGGSSFPMYTGGQTTTPAPLGSGGLSFNRNYNEGTSAVGRMGWFADQNPMAAAGGDPYTNWLNTYGVAPGGQASGGYMGDINDDPYAGYA